MVLSWEVGRVLKVLRDVDPVGIGRFDPDEYLPEAELISAGITRWSTRLDVANAVSMVFEAAFGGVVSISKIEEVGRRLGRRLGRRFR